jgi:hypothetical protein
MLRTTPPAKIRGPGGGQSQRSADTRRIGFYAFISLASFLCGAILLAVLIQKADVLTHFGLIGQVYYPVLIIFGLCSAVFLFGVLQSYATYRGRHFGGVLELGGPVVVFALVIAGARFLVPENGTFSIQVYVHGPGGIHDRVLPRLISIALYLDKPETQSLDDEGKAVFPAVPGRFRDQTVPMSVLSDVYLAADSSERLRLTPGLVYLTVKLRICRPSFHVHDESGEPVSGAEITVDSTVLGNTNHDGNLTNDLPLHSPELPPSLLVNRTGYQPYKHDIDPCSEKPIEVSLKPER